MADQSSRAMLVANSIRLSAVNGLLKVENLEGQPLLVDCRATVELSSSVQYTTDGGVSEKTAEGLVIRSPGTALRPELRWHISPGEGRSLRLWLEIENTTAQSLAVERLDVLVAPSGYYQAPASGLAVLQTGWQSWSPASPTLPLALQCAPAPPPIVGPMLSPTEAERTLLPWMTLLHLSGDRRLLAGFISANDQEGVLAIQPALVGHRLTASTYLEGIPLQPNTTVRSETLLLIFDEGERAALGRYAQELATTMEARSWPHIPTGWCSWYYFFTAVTEADILRNLETISSRRIPIEYVQLDDGYQMQIGDWLTLNERFPHGMRFLTDAIRLRGYKPGIWLAPFLVSEHSVVYSQHPNWVVHDLHDQPITAIYNWGSRNYALDTTNPEVEAWLRHVVDTIVNQWGYEYLKIDFVYAAALRGRRYDQNATGIQAYRRGLRIIRETAGDSFVLGCGAPFAPSVGLVDGMRIGPDVASFWQSEHGGKGSAPALENALRSTLAHWWMHRRLWVNDPDCLLLRQRDSHLTLPEVQSWASLVALSGGMILLSDDLSQLEPEREEIIWRVLPPLGEAAIPSGPYVNGMATRLQLTVDRPWEHWRVVALFNWGNEVQSLLFDPADWDGIGDVPYHLFDIWTGQHWGPQRGAVKLESVPPHGVKLLAVHIDHGRPQLIGSTLHLLGGALEVADEHWQDNTLRLTLSSPNEHCGDLVMFVPQGYEYQSIEGEHQVVQRDRLLIIPVHLVDRTGIIVRFRKEG
jgi:alpha-galactosidase